MATGLKRSSGLADGGNTMIVIDVDSHYEPDFRLDEHPLEQWRDRFPTTTDRLAAGMTGELAQSTPEDSRPSAEAVAALCLRENASGVRNAIEVPPPPLEFEGTTARGRISWMDRIGIHHALVNPGSFAQLVQYLGPDRPEGTRRCNDYLADRLEGFTDRLSPVTIVDFSDLDGAVVELTRMRARGSRAFYVVAQPFHGMSPAHPDWDRLWSAVTDLGMVAILHAGQTPANFEGWGNAGWEEPGGTGLAGYFRYAYSMRRWR